ncbi:NgoFVII family restriction endonuclease [Campylobacterota bacterium]|nr:NgoFVII family restriction endonuclease [Campylobacterota bacterium]
MSSIILKQDLFKEVLLRPAEKFDTICVVSGFATPAMVAHHLEAVKKDYKKEDIRVNLIIGMTPLCGISEPNHENFKKLARDIPDFKCSYINQTSLPIHTKLYTWLKNGEPRAAFLSSANYTLSAFSKHQDEVATECDPVEAFKYYSSKIIHSLYCTLDEANDLVLEREAHVEELLDAEHTLVETDGESVQLPLFSERDKKMHSAGAGLNWGQGRAGRTGNEAYIPIPSKIAKSEFFPRRGNHFSVLTEDGIPFVCAVTQDGNKAIDTPNNNSELGEYLRRKLGVRLGQGYLVELADLDRYGSRYVKFTKINEEEYYMEF